MFRKELLQICVICLKHNFRLYPTPAQTPSFTETCDWGVMLEKQPSSLALWGCGSSSLLRAPRPHLLGEGGVLHLGWMNSRFSGQYSSWEKVETSGKRMSTEMGRKVNGRESRGNALHRQRPVRTLSFHLQFSQSIPAYFLLLSTSLGMAGAGPSTWKSTIKTKSSADAAAQRGSYIQDHRPWLQLSRCSSEVHRCGERP